jgi:hypothetical protein
MSLLGGGTGRIMSSHKLMRSRLQEVPPRIRKYFIKQNLAVGGKSMQSSTAGNQGGGCSNGSHRR